MISGFLDVSGSGGHAATPRLRGLGEALTERKLSSNFDPATAGRMTEF